MPHEIMKRGLLAAGLLAASCASAGCFREPRWLTVAEPNTVDAEIALTSRHPIEMNRDPSPDNIPTVPIRSRLRPCCAFGMDLTASVGRVPVPRFRIGNLLGPEEVGPHTFDSGVLHIRRADQQDPLVNNENNGLVYTCRGGFIDTAHVRDYADWAISIGTWIGRELPEAATLRLPDEGGTRTIVLEPIPPEVMERWDRITIASLLGQWVVFQLSIWHEIATWYWWSSLPGFPEKASAFSPEDLYSNMVGIRMAMLLSYRRNIRTERVYNAAMTRWLEEVFATLRAVPADVGREAMGAVDGVWWDSGKRLPDAHLVIRRSFDLESPVDPWIVPESRTSPALRAALREHCGDDAEPLPLPLFDEWEAIRPDDWVNLRIEVDDGLAVQEPFPSLGRSISDDDFAAILSAIRAQNRAEFGAGSDRPD